jgi:hypothetical protein
MLENNLDRCLDTRRLCLIGEFVSKNKFGKPILRNSVCIFVFEKLILFARLN